MKLSFFNHNWATGVKQTIKLFFLNKVFLLINYFFYRGITDPLIAEFLKTSAYCGRRTEFINQSTMSWLVHLRTASQDVKWTAKINYWIMSTVIISRSQSTMTIMFQFIWNSLFLRQKGWDALETRCLNNQSALFYKLQNGFKFHACLVIVHLVRVTLDVLDITGTCNLHQLLQTNAIIIVTLCHLLVLKQLSWRQSNSWLPQLIFVYCKLTTTPPITSTSYKH